MFSLQQKFLQVILLSRVLLAPVSAQVDTGTISGVVKDSSGAVIPRAEVRATETSTALSSSAQANDSGYYSIPDLRPGVYDLSVRVPGFERIMKTNISARVQDHLEIDFDLQVGQTSTEVLVYELRMPFYETEQGVRSDLEQDPLYGTLLQAADTGNNGDNPSFQDPNYHNFAPRAGFAFKIDIKTVIRSAFGIFYGRDENVPVARRPVNNPPWYILRTYTSDHQIDPNIVLSQGFPSNALDPSNIKTPTVNSDLKDSPAPYIEQWNFNVQRELGGSFVAQVGYVGSSSHDLYYPDQINTPAPGPGFIQARRPLPAYGPSYAYAPLVDGNYHAQQAQLERRFSRGLSLLAAYTWSHSIDNGSSQADSDNFIPLNPFNFRAERGNSNLDVRHRFVASAVYELPFGKGKPLLNRSRIGSAVLGGWELTGIFRAQSGVPFTPVLSVDNTNTGTTARPNRISNGTLPSGERVPADWFDESAFVIPAGFAYGNSGRNILSGPGFHNLDRGLSRFFSFTERISAEFRAESFNLLILHSSVFRTQRSVKLQRA